MTYARSVGDAPVRGCGGSRGDVSPRRPGRRCGCRRPAGRRSAPRWVTRTGGAGVPEHVGQPVGRVGGIERHVGAAGLEDAEQTDDHLQAALDAQADQVAGPGRQRPRWRASRSAAHVQLAVRQVLAGAGDGGASGRRGAGRDLSGIGRRRGRAPGRPNRCTTRPAHPGSSIGSVATAAGLGHAGEQDRQVLRPKRAMVAASNSSVLYSTRAVRPPSYSRIRRSGRTARPPGPRVVGDRRLARLSSAGRSAGPPWPARAGYGCVTGGTGLHQALERHVRMGERVQDRSSVPPSSALNDASGSMCERSTTVLTRKPTNCSRPTLSLPRAVPTAMSRCPGSGRRPS